MRLTYSTLAFDSVSFHTFLLMCSSNTFIRFYLESNAIRAAHSATHIVCVDVLRLASDVLTTRISVCASQCYVQRKLVDERMQSHYYYYYFMIDYQINLNEMMT